MPLYGPAILATATAAKAETTIGMLKGTNRPALASGIDKLVQQVMYLLLTQADSIEGFAGYGASPFGDLVSVVVSGNLAEINSLLAEATQEIINQLGKLQRNVDDDARLGTLSIVATDFDRATSDLAISVTVGAVAGTAATYNLRVPVR